jgi:hypothetical protein
MDKSEQAAYEYLGSCGFDKRDYEPDGQVPPDFVVDDRIAVEVRRLNQMRETDGRISGLEQIQRSLDEKVPELLKNFGPSTDGESWFVFISFKRPLPRWRQLRAGLRDGLSDFAKNSARVSSRIRIENNLTIRLDRATSVHEDLFVFAGYSDCDAGGWVLSELEPNIAICLSEKSAKIAPFRAKYCEWWLILIDRIAHANIERSEVIELRKQLCGLTNWDRVLLVNPSDSIHGLQIWPPESPTPA